MKFLVKDFELTNENIVSVRDECGTSYSKYSGKRGNEKLKLKLELAIEEYLIRFKEIYGEGVRCRVVATKSFGNLRFELHEIGPQKDPMQVTELENEYTEQILQSYGQAPIYSYNTKSQSNVVTFEAQQLPVKNKMLKEIAVALILAIATALLIKLLPKDTCDLINDSLIGPLFTKITAVITAIATPLVFFGVVSGITGIGSSSAIGNMGKRLLGNMSITYVISAVIFSAFAVLLYPVSMSSQNGSGAFLKDLVQLVLDIIPSNLLECFTTDNDLQVIVIAIFLGVILLSFGERAKKINDAITLIGDIVNKMMAVVCKTLPFIVYLGILRMMLSSTAGLLQLYKVALAWILSVVVILIYLLIKVKRTVNIPFKKLFDKQVPTLMINLATSSQVAALPENMICCKEKFGIDDKFVNFSLPLGIVTYMPAGAAFLGLTAWGIANMSGVVMDPASVFKLAVVAVIVAIAAPPIPGSAFAVMPIIFSSCNIPMDYYSIAIICGTILGYFLPAANGYFLQLELLIAAKQLKIVDEDKLNS